MASPVIMPRQGQSVESCIIVKWFKKKGDPVAEGDVLFTYETDKAAFDEEAKTSGTILDIFFEEGEDIPVLTNVCVIGNAGESTSEFNPNAAAPGEASKSIEAVPEALEQNAVNFSTIINTASINENAAVKISPRARNLAERIGVDFSNAIGTGPYGRIIEKDINALRESGPLVTPAARDQYPQTRKAVTGTGLGGRITTSDLAGTSPEVSASSGAAVQAASHDVLPLYEEVKLTNIRKVIAKAMLNSITTTCQLTLNSSFDASDILAYRKNLKSSRDRLGLENITINDIISYAVSRTLLQHKALNANLIDDKMIYFKNVNLGIAVDTERGLMVPTLFDANLKSLNEISAETKKLAQECQKGIISPDLLKGGSFTVSNLGTLDIESFTPVLNAPQTGILGVGTIIQRARDINGEYEFYPAMTLSLTFDHRALDGAPAAKFLQDLKKNLENFSILLSK